MQVILFSSIAQALSSPLFGKSLTVFAPIRRADGGERARHCRPGWERCCPEKMNSRLNVLPPAASLRVPQGFARDERVGVSCSRWHRTGRRPIILGELSSTTRYLHPQDLHPQGGLR